MQNEGIFRRFLNTGFLGYSNTYRSQKNKKSIPQFDISNSKVLPDINDAENSNKVVIEVTAKGNFNSIFGIFFCCIGSAVGCGNIWRFPRIIAQNSSPHGSLSFIIAWIISLPLWSMPITITECALGRFIRAGPILALKKFMGSKMIWLGLWIWAVNFFQGAYYSVLVGWCVYYVYYTSSLTSLPTESTVSLAAFQEFTQKSYYPVLTHFIVMTIVGLCIVGGLKWIEHINTLLVSLLFIIVIINFCWAISLQYADLGIKYLFTPNFEKLADPKLWVDAFAQNAFDTGAGIGLYSAYASYFRRTDNIVLIGILAPMVNNLVSLLAGISMYSTVFATLVKNHPTYTTIAIHNIIGDSGPASTGLTFTWIPVFYASMGVTGRVFCGLFFICLSFAGISTLTAYLQFTVLTLKNFKCPHRWAVAITLIITTLVGLPSSLNLNILANQDFVWGVALLISGGIFILTTLMYGIERFRKIIINKFGFDQTKLPVLWTLLMLVFVPVELVGFLGWWAVDLVSTQEAWYVVTETSFMITIIEWGILFLFIGSFNILYIKFRWDLFTKSDRGGYDPYSLDEIPGMITDDIYYDTDSYNMDKNIKVITRL